MILTDAQQTAYDKIRTEWNGNCGEPYQLIGSVAVLVQVCTSDGGWTIGIEPDGYTHS